MAYTLSALLVIATIGSQIYQGEQAGKAARKGERAQKDAQRRASNTAITQERLAAQSEAAANKKRPNVRSILFDEQSRESLGPASTILAGRGGGNKPLLGRNSLLGG